MNWDLSPKVIDNKVFEGDGGSYWSWSRSKFPLLGEAKVGGGQLLLHPHGFALPHYADSSKIGYVLQGSCTVGMAFPNTSEEKVLIIKKGDAIPVPVGVVSWWFNGGDSDLVILFIGETSKAYSPGEFTYFFLTGTLGVLRGFSTDFVGRVYNMNKEEANKLVKSQTGSLLIKLGEEGSMLQPCKDTNHGPRNDMAVNIETALLGTDVKNGGLVTTLTATEFPLLEQVGLSAKLEKLDANAVSSPMYSADSTVTTYVVKGSGRIQIVGLNGEQALDSKVQGGDLFVVPRFFVAAKIADEDGMECFSVITSSHPVFGELKGNASLWKALSPVVLQTALSVTPEFAQLFISKN